MVGCKEDELIRESTKSIQSHTIEINVCDYPYSAIPGDTISDFEAFQLAVDVANSLKERSILDTLCVIIVVPIGEYIIDRTLDFKNTSLEISQYYSIFGINGSNIIGSNVYITDY
jgi:hypothetical protein